MRGIFSRGRWKALFGLGKKPGLIGCQFTTDGANAPTMVNTTGIDTSEGGLITVSNPTGNTYRVTYPGTFGSCQCAIAKSNLDATLNNTPTATPGSGYVDFAFSGALTSATVQVLMYFDGETRG